MLSEARSIRLALKFSPLQYKTKIFRQIVEVANPLNLVFEGSDHEETKLSPPTFTMENGICVKMWDMAGTHKNSQYRVRINNESKRFFLATNPRDIFTGDDHRLIGYCGNGE